MEGEDAGAGTDGLSLEVDLRAHTQDSRVAVDGVGADVAAFAAAEVGAARLTTLQAAGALLGVKLVRQLNSLALVVDVGAALGLAVRNGDELVPKELVPDLVAELPGES